MTAQLLLLLCFYLVLPIMYFSFRHEAKRKNRLRFGITLPAEHLGTNEVAIITEEFFRRLRIMALLLAPWPLLSLLLSFSLGFTLLMLWLFAALVLMYLPYIRAHREMKAYQAAHALPEGDDRYWFYGTFYKNKNDPRLTVPCRVGHNTTVNLAKPAGKAVIIFTILVLLMLPVICGWLIAEEYTPIRAELTEDALLIRHLKTEAIPLDTVRSVTLLDTLPSANRTVGSETPTRLKGTFSVEGYGSCSLSLDPSAPPFLVLQAEGGTYLFHDSQSVSATLTLYEELLARLQ